MDDIFTGPSLSSSSIYLRAVIDKHIRMIPPKAAEGIREVLLGAITIQNHIINIVPHRGRFECFFAFRSLGMDRPYGSKMLSDANLLSI